MNLLHIFGGGSDGGFPFGGVILSGNTLYGTTQSPATVFRINTDGTGFLPLHCLSCDHETNSRNIQIFGGLVLAGESLYGMTLEGGLYNVGFIFRLDTNGAGFTNLHNFNVSEGSRPFFSSLIVSGSRLYGTTTQGGTNGAGTVFAMNTDGSEFTVLHNFRGFEEGGGSSGALALSGNTLYGTVPQVGIYQNGNVFAVNTDGTGFRTVYSFTGGADGGQPEVGLTVVGNSLYGTTTVGGNSGNGTIFRLTLPVMSALQPALVHSQTNMVITWPTNDAGLVLQSTTKLGSSATWSTVSSGPFIVNGQNTVTNAISSAQQFFRLSR